MVILSGEDFGGLAKICSHPEWMGENLHARFVSLSPIFLFSFFFSEGEVEVLV